MRPLTWLQVTSSHPLLAMLHPLALIDLLSFAPSLVGAVLPLYSAPWGIDLRWFRVFRSVDLQGLVLMPRMIGTSHMCTAKLNPL